MEFREIFQKFYEYHNCLKVVFVASCSDQGQPNSAPKPLVDINLPNKLYFLDYRFTATFANLKTNPQVSVSFMDDAVFTGFRLSGSCELISAGPEYEAVKKVWEKKVNQYEAERIIERVKGGSAPREAENVIPKDFVLVRMQADQAAVVKPDRVLRGERGPSKTARKQG